MQDTHLIKPVHIYADYRVDVQQVREKYEELLRASDDWDEKKEPVLEVTNVTEETIELRALCSARDPSAAWSFHCWLREELVGYLRELEDGRYLPRRRIELPEQKEE